MRQTTLLKVLAALVAFGSAASAADSQLMNMVMPDAKVLAGVNGGSTRMSPFGQFIIVGKHPGIFGAERNHDRAGKRKSQGRRQDARPIDFTAKTFRERMHSRDLVGSKATNQSNGVAEQGVARVGGFSERGKEEKVSRWTKRGKHKGAVSQQRQQRQQGDCNEAIQCHVRRPDRLRRQVRQQPTEAKAFNKREDVGCAMVRWRGWIRLLHLSYMFGSKSKYSSSSLIPPSPSPRVFSEVTNSMRSIHFTIL